MTAIGNSGSNQATGWATTWNPENKPSWFQAAQSQRTDGADNREVHSQDNTNVYKWQASDGSWHMKSYVNNGDGKETGSAWWDANNNKWVNDTDTNRKAPWVA
jgi:hypothetical protein